MLKKLWQSLEFSLYHALCKTRKSNNVCCDACLYTTYPSTYIDHNAHSDHLATGHI
jgi:hypothetical protein